MSVFNDEAAVSSSIAGTPSTSTSFLRRLPLYHSSPSSSSMCGMSCENTLVSLMTPSLSPSRLPRRSALRGGTTTPRRAPARTTVSLCPVHGVVRHLPELTLCITAVQAPIFDSSAATTPELPYVSFHVSGLPVWGLGLSTRFLRHSFSSQCPLPISLLWNIRASRGYRPPA